MTLVGALRRRVCLAGAAVLAVASVAGCESPPSLPSSGPSSHDASWIDSAVARVGTQSGHDPVVRVAIDPAGVTVTTRRSDTRVQREWRVDLDSENSTPVATLTPAPVPTPHASRTSAHPSASPTDGRLGATGTTSGSTATATSTQGATGTPQTGVHVTPTGPRTTPTPVFATPSGAPATPLPTPRVDNTLGNMELGSFGDSQVTPMWQWMQAHHCRSDDWSMVLTAVWAGNVVDHGTCGTQHMVMLDGGRLPYGPYEVGLLAMQLRRLNGLVTDRVARVSVARTGQRTCPTRVSVDYGVQQGGPLNLRTTLTCSDLTTQMLSGGWLPPGTIAVDDLQAKGVEAVFRDQAKHHQPITALVAQHSLLYGLPVLVPASSTTGRPTYAMDGTPRK